MEQMEKIFKQFFKSSIITSCVLLLVGILLIFKSEFTIITISYVLGAILVALGVMAMLRFFSSPSKTGIEELDIVYGIVTTLSGILIITYPKAIASVLPIIIGIGILINSSMKLQYAFELKSSGNDLWKSTMIIAVISVLCGILLIFNPFKSAEFITRIIGIFITIYAILDIISTIEIRKNVKVIKNTIENATMEAEVVEEKETVKAEKPVKKSKNSTTKKQATKKKTATSKKTTKE